MVASLQRREAASIRERGRHAVGFCRTRHDPGLGPCSTFGPWICSTRGYQDMMRCLYARPNNLCRASVSCRVITLRQAQSTLLPCTHKSRLVSSGWSMSALPPKANIRQRIEHVCFVPGTDILAGGFVSMNSDFDVGQPQRSALALRAVAKPVQFG
jgi:hypothetical protein